VGGSQSRLRPNCAACASLYFRRRGCGKTHGLNGSKRAKVIALRNVSDPQFKAQGTLSKQAQLAAQIYKGFGRWSTVCSSIVCWPLIATE